MGNSTVKSMARSDPTVFRSDDMFKGAKKTVIDPLTKYTTDIATIPIKAVKAGVKRGVMKNGNKTKKNKG
tara:strand:- start:180 stop:389 length:210 start_codon:yes stop_codon:yes gene_type:complete